MARPRRGPAVTDAGGVRVVVYAPDAPAPANRAVTAAVARPTRWTPRGEITATVSGMRHRAVERGLDAATGSCSAGARLARGSVAIAIGDRRSGARGAGRSPCTPRPPERGWVAGSVELEPDELRRR